MVWLNAWIRIVTHNGTAKQKTKQQTNAAGLFRSAYCLWNEHIPWMKRFACNSCTACGVDCTVSEYAITNVEQNSGSTPGCKDEIKSERTAKAVYSFWERSNLKSPQGITVTVSTGSGAPSLRATQCPVVYLDHPVFGVHKYSGLVFKFGGWVEATTPPCKISHV
jgi:hypothetical protein